MGTIGALGEEKLSDRGEFPPFTLMADMGELEELSESGRCRNCAVFLVLDSEQGEEAEPSLGLLGLTDLPFFFSVRDEVIPADPVIWGISDNRVSRTQTFCNLISDDLAGNISSESESFSPFFNLLFSTSSSVADIAAISHSERETVLC